MNAQAWMSCPELWMTARDISPFLFPLVKKRKLFHYHKLNYSHFPCVLAETTEYHLKFKFFTSSRVSTNIAFVETLLLKAPLYEFFFCLSIPFSTFFLRKNAFRNWFICAILDLDFVPIFAMVNPISTKMHDENRDCLVNLYG